MKNRWSLVVHEVSQSTAQIWIGTLFPNERKYDAFVVRILLGEDVVAEKNVFRDDFERPFSTLNQRFYKSLTFENLDPGNRYDIQLLRETQSIEGHELSSRILSSGSFTTLPSALNGLDNPFVVALGSCYYEEGDGGQTAGAYEALLHSEQKQFRPDVKFLTGDQVYLDIGLDSLSPVEDEITNRIADDYATAWQSLRGLLRNGGTWMLADDHEYWNNYPNVSGANPYLWMISASDRVKRIWKRCADDGIKNVQRISTVRSFDVGNDLSFCFADVRSFRTETQFLPDADFTKLIDWAENLSCPGVLVVAQPVMVKPGGSADKNLANFKAQYSRLMTALAASGFDIVVLSGDVHFGRIGRVELGENGTVLHEIVSSPLSNLTGIDGKVAAGRAKKLKRFPAVNIDGLSPSVVNYPKEWKISAQRVKSWFFPSNHTKTKEHFFTLGFAKTADGVVNMEVQAWRLRERTRKGLPKAQFRQAHAISLS